MPLRDHETFIHKCTWAILAMLHCGFAYSGAVPHFERIGHETGISHRSVFAIEQDRRGFLWIGTADGLNRFDGRECRIWRHDEDDPTSLSSNVIHVVLEDRNEQLWIGTASGVDRFDRETGIFDHLDLSPYYGIENRLNIHFISEDSSGDIWIGGADLLVRYNGKIGVVTAFLHDPSDPASLPRGTTTAINEDLEGDIWVLSSIWGSRPLILSQLLSDGTFSHHPAPSGWESSGGFTIDPFGRFWINVAGIGAFDPTKGTFGTVFHEKEHASLGQTSIDSSNRVLMPAFGGLVRFDPVEGTREVLTLADDQEFLAAIPLLAYEDRAGALWVGTRGGLFVADPNQKLFTHIEHQRGDPSSLASNQVSSIVETESGIIWVGTYGGGLHRIDAEGNLFRYQHDPADSQSLCHDIIWDLAEDDDGDLWIGFEFGLCRYQPDTNTFTVIHDLEFPAASGPDNRITALLNGPDQTLWVGSSFGLLKYEPLTGRYDPVQTLSAKVSYCNINNLAQGHDNSLWVASGGACNKLFRLDNNTSEPSLELEVIESVELESEGIFDLAVDDSDVIWLATVSGLGRFDLSTGEYEALNTRDGLPGTVVFSILEDPQGLLWLGTNHGLSRFDPKGQGPDRFRNFYVQDGIGSVEFNRHAALAAADGRFYFGGMHGLTVFSPHEIRDNPVIPPVEITGIRVWGRSGSREVIAHGTEQLRLDHYENSFEIRFTALNFTNSQDNRFRYRLHGHDSVENEGGTTGFARYSQIKPGRYRFQVLGSNNDLVWNNKGTSLTIIIDPPFWQSWWGRSLSVIALIAAIFGAHRYRVSKLLEVERLRWRIAADLHDDLSSDLSGVALAAALLKKRGLSSTTESLRLHEIENTARSMVDRLRDVVWCVNPEHDSLDAVVRRMRSVVGSLLNDVDCDFEVDVPDTNPGMAMSHRRNLMLIYKECLHNISRHADATKVIIRLSAKEQVLTLRITDNGRGFSPETTRDGQGLASMRRRALTMGAELDMTSVPGGGSSLTLILKMARTRGGQG